MLFSASKFLDIAVQATDGEIGKVKDMYFDDKTWAVRYVVVTCGEWADKKDVLLIPSHLQVPNALTPILITDSTKQQVFESPTPGSDLPVSRQYEIDLYSHYSLAPYWSYPTVGYGFSAYYPDVGETDRADRFARKSAQEMDFDPHLRSLKEVQGYHIKTQDDELGHVVDVLISRESAEVTHFVVDTVNWWPSKHVLIEVGAIRSFDWEFKTLSTSLDKETIKGAPVFDEKNSFDPEYMEKLWEYYHRYNTPWKSGRVRIDSGSLSGHSL